LMASFSGHEPTSVLASPQAFGSRNDHTPCL
jgi:hypothetical protein